MVLVQDNEKRKLRLVTFPQRAWTSLHVVWQCECERWPHLHGCGGVGMDRDMLRIGIGGLTVCINRLDSADTGVFVLML